MLLRLILQQLLRQTAEQTLRDAITRQASPTHRGSSDPSAENAQGRDEGAAAVNSETQPLPPCSIAILFASAFEAGGLVDRLEERVETRCVGVIEYQGRLGAHRVAVGVPRTASDSLVQSATDLIDFHQPRWFITAGFAASLQEELPRNHLLLASEIADTDGHRLATGLQVDPESLAKWPTIKVGRLLTTRRVLRTPKEREAIGRQHDAMAADLESMAIAEICQQRKIPCLALRVITESMDDQLSRELENLQRQGSWAGKLGATAGVLMRRPETLKDWWSMKQRGIDASDRLAKLIEGMVAQLP